MTDSSCSEDLWAASEILHAICAPSEQAVRERLADDSWARNGMLAIKSIEPWTILLDGRDQ